MKLKIHSVVDLITNSSTIIFTYSEGSLPALKELVNEMLKAFGKDETFDDIFFAEIFLEGNDEYYNTLERLCEEDPTIIILDYYDYIETIKQRVLKEEMKKPSWMLEAENAEDSYSYYRFSSVLEILPKDEKYKELANLLLNYLYSTDHEATRDG